MSTELGKPKDYPIGSNTPIEIPDSQVPPQELAQDRNLQIFDPSETVGGGAGGSYKFLASITDSLPDFLDAKIETQFEVQSNKLVLVGFGALTADDLTEGATNKYFNQTGFDSFFDTKTTDDLTEGATSKYYNSSLFDSDFSGKTTDDLTQGISNFYYASSLFDIDFGNKTTDDLSEGVSNFYYSSTLFDADLASKTLDDIAIGTTNLHFTSTIKQSYDNHIVDTLIHVPTVVINDDIGKHLVVGADNIPAWTEASSGLSLTGESYISLANNVLTVGKPNLSQVDFAAGTNISFNLGTNTISATQRAISASPISGDNQTSISAGWAFTHNAATGVGSHIPLGGDGTKYLAGDGTWKSFEESPGGVYKVQLSAGGPTGDIDVRLAGATFPSGWSGAKASVTSDLEITHDVNSSVVDVKIYADDGSNFTQLVSSAAYTTITGNSANTLITIQSLATIDQPLNIYLQFE